jgi:hypothetical protein
MFVDIPASFAVSNFTSTGYQEGGAAYTGTWRSASPAGAWGGTSRYTTAASASATFHCSSCRALAWVTDQDSAHGSARVYVDKPPHFRGDKFTRSRRIHKIEIKV